MHPQYSRKYITIEIRDKKICDLRKRGLKLSYIARLFNTTDKNIYRVCKKFGVRFRYFYKIKRCCRHCKSIFYVKPSTVKIGHGIFCSLRCMGLGRPDEINEKISRSKKGISVSPYTQFKKGQVSLWKGKKRPEWSGMNHPSWKGGVTPINEKIRKSIEYKDWRTKVFKRDNYTCQMCGIRGNKTYLNADHIKPFAIFPELRFELENGRTLCKYCHRKTKTWGVNLLTKDIYNREYK
jgi:hypothetical protein